MVPPDPDGGVSEVQYAVVYAPKRTVQLEIPQSKKLSKRTNKRFSANCVEIKESEEQAQKESDVHASRFPAKVLGPSKSSEGQYIFYLVEWLLGPKS